MNNLNDGIDPGFNCWLRSCLASGNGINGFGLLTNNWKCTYQDCVADHNGGSGYWTDSECTFLNCRGSENLYDGFGPFDGCVLRNCSASGNLNDGFDTPFVGCVLEGCEADENDGEAGILADHTILKDCTATFNGNDGIDAGDGSALSGCEATVNGGWGINASNYCTLSDCAADTNTFDGIVTDYGCAVSQCSSSGSENGSGFLLGSGNTISGCSAFRNALDGIDAGDRTTVRDCTATMNGIAGIRVAYQGMVQQCTSGNNGSFGILSDTNGYASILDNDCSFNGILTFGGTPSQGAGIYITNSPGCRIEGNTLDANYAALVVAANNHAFVLRNDADDNVSTNYAIASGNSWGPIVDVSAGGDIANVANSSHPDANFIH